MGERRILCFGDSLTWGWVPRSPPVPTERYGARVRWPGVLAEQLGPGRTVVEEALSGRTTTADDPTDPRLNASRYLPAALASHLPLDVVVILLGSNDTKAYLRRTPLDIAVGASVLLGQVAASAGGVGTSYPAPAALLVCPPPVGETPDPWFGAVFDGSREKGLALPPLYRAAAANAGAAYLDAGAVITTDGVDGVHLTEENNADLGAAVAAEVRALLAEG